ncbi:hypothetical protein [Bacillus rubiinfantis]|uniref:hypothetical protein n=1 Tax=Bacillus rubiinfantis TaxID=1499680 RepID=UPI0005AA595D|nr:hypothetical protein [Bacillus rubiinfantis]
MAYIIENAHILKSRELVTNSLLIQEDKVLATITSPRQYRLIKMNLDHYIMTPSYVLLSSKITPQLSFQQMKELLIQQFLLKGCTTLITYVNVSYESELVSKVNEMKATLMSSPIDYLIGIKIPVRLITPSLIRICKKERIPAIFIEVDHRNELNEVPWGWIREALFPYNCPFVPIISSLQKKEVKPLLSNWKHIMEKQKIPAIYEEIQENTPISITVLNKIGLYPQKYSFMNGAELSYNLYLKTREIKNVDEVDLFHYHSDRLVITVHKGKIVRTLNKVQFKSGFGEHIMVRTPAFFSL